MGLPIPKKTDGISFIPALNKSRNVSERSLYSEVFIPRSFNWSELKGIRKGKWFYIDAPQPELYCIGENQTEAQNLINKYPAAGDRLKKDMEGLDEQINVKKEIFHALKAERERAFGNGDALEEKQETEKTLKEKKEKVESIKQETRQIYPTLSDKQRQKQTTEKILQDIQHESKAVEQLISNRAASLGFSTLEELQSSLLHPEQREALEQKKESIDYEIAHYTAELETIREKLGEEDPKRVTVESLEDLSIEIQEARKRKDELGQELSVVLDRLERHEASEKEYGRLIQEMEQQEKVCDRINDEKSFFETAGEVEIRMRVRELMLERLLEHSNRHLEELSGRYYLRRREKNGLELEIEDVFQHRARRPVNTLSGGESFLVSISMALGLSDIAGNGRKIESLFIDEGFGYLDDETLYNVLSTLKNLKNTRKMVGIISHVKMLEDEIPTKIKITKLSGGMSRLDVVA